MKKINKLTAIAILCAVPLFASQANASLSQKQIDTTIKELLKVGIPIHSDEELRKQGCSPDVWGDMVNQYIKARGIKLTVENEAKEQIQMETPKNEWQQCFSNAMGKINSLKNKANKIWGMFTGEVSEEEVLGGIADDFFEEACSRINKESGAIVGGVTGQIGQGMDKGVDQIIDKVNDASGDLNLGDRIIDSNKENKDNPLFKNENYTLDDISGGAASKVGNDYMNLFGSNKEAGSAFGNLIK